MILLGRLPAVPAFQRDDGERRLQQNRLERNRRGTVCERLDTRGRGVTPHGLAGALTARSAARGPSGSEVLVQALGVEMMAATGPDASIQQRAQANRAVITGRLARFHQHLPPRHSWHALLHVVAKGAMSLSLPGVPIRVSLRHGFINGPGDENGSIAIKLRPPAAGLPSRHAPGHRGRACSSAPPEPRW